jgi:hypothetical protein
VWLVSRLANALNYVRNLLLARFLRHVDDHCCLLGFSVNLAKIKAAISDRGLWLNLADCSGDHFSLDLLASRAAAAAPVKPA